MQALKKVSMIITNSLWACAQMTLKRITHLRIKGFEQNTICKQCFPSHNSVAPYHCYCALKMGITLEIPQDSFKTV